MSYRSLESLLQEYYGIHSASVHLLAKSWDGSVHLVICPDTSRFTLRITSLSSAQADAQVLAFLERQRYPAPRLMRTLGGAAGIPQGDETVTVSSFIDGTAAGYSPTILHRLGEQLGRLHILPIPDDGTLPAADMLPASDMQLALDWLQPVSNRVPPALQPTYRRLVEAIRDIRDFSRLPHSLIHNDAHPGNSVMTPDGDVVFIDWHGAGLGAPIIDLAFLLISSEIAPSWAEPLTPDPTRLPAIVDGYARNRIPAEDELDLLPDAIRFRSLLYGAGHLTAAVQNGLDALSESWWWERYEKAEEVAARARQRFAAHEEG